jgi:hypothetical protein
MSHPARPVRTLLALLAIVGPLAAGADALMPKPGRYEITTYSEFGDLPIPPTTVTTSNCVTADDLAEDPRKIFADLPAADDCSLDTFTMENGKLVMRLHCKTDHGSMSVNGDGDYTPESYRMNTVINIESGDTQLHTTATVDARRLGDC